MGNIGILFGLFMGTFVFLTGLESATSVDIHN